VSPPKSPPSIFSRWLGFKVVSQDLLEECRIMLRFAVEEGLSIAEDVRKNIARLDHRLIAANLEPISLIPTELIRDSAKYEAEELAAAKEATGKTGGPGNGSEPTPNPAGSGTTSADQSASSPQSAQSSAGPTAAYTPQPASAAAISAEPAPPTTTELVLALHAALSRLIAPATALTLQVSEPPPDVHNFLGGMPILVRFATLFSLIFAAGFVATSIPSAKKAIEKSLAAGSPNPTPTPSATPSATPASQTATP
jgi:hypothetical protein